MSILEIVVKFKTCRSIYEYVYKMMKKYNVCVGLGVLLFAAFINTYVSKLPLYILQFAGHVQAFLLKTSYEAVAESWEVLLWQRLLAKFLALVILVFAVFKESRMVLSGVNQRNCIYRVVGCCILVIYAIGVCVGIIAFRYSVAVIVLNWWFWPVLILYLVTGLIFDKCVKGAVGVSEEAEKEEKEETV